MSVAHVGNKVMWRGSALVIEKPNKNTYFILMLFLKIMNVNNVTDTVIDIELDIDCVENIVLNDTRVNLSCYS
jgi:hypothetical protein